MTSIKFRLFFLLTLFAGTTMTLSWVSYSSFQYLMQARRDLDLSYDLREEMENLAALKSGSDLVLKIQQHLDQISPKTRQEEFTSLLQAAHGNAPGTLRERHKVFLRNEAEYQRFQREQLNYLEKKLLYYGSLAVVIMVLGFISLQVFIHRSVIRPLADLSRKMVDFLNDRYTYQFSVAANDEVGQMQATFNSLAQRVISNMEELRTLDQAKSEFLSIASHELRTPLTSIKGSLSLMRSGVVGTMNEMAENLLTIAENETDRLIRLINDILDLAKIEARKLPLQQNWHSFGQLTKTCLESLQGLAQQADVRLASDAAPSLEVYMDSDRIQQVLTNLLSNAIKFSPPGKSVIVSCEINKQNQLVVEVRDQGRGIAPEDQEAIFQKFRQATNSRNPLVKGTGLGLAIAKALVEQHGGEISVRSVPGEGSSFFFTLPEWRYGEKQASEVAA